jgi:hypothetical protein
MGAPILRGPHRQVLVDGLNGDRAADDMGGKARTPNPTRVILSGAACRGPHGQVFVRGVKAKNLLSRSIAATNLVSLVREGRERALIALSSPMPFHLLGKVKSSTSVLTRSF